MLLEIHIVMGTSLLENREEILVLTMYYTNGFVSNPLFRNGFFNVYTVCPCPLQELLLLERP
jgi:hypothetical protein